MVVCTYPIINRYDNELFAGEVSNRVGVRISCVPFFLLYAISCHVFVCPYTIQSLIFKSVLTYTFFEKFFFFLRRRRRRRKKGKKGKRKKKKKKGKNEPC